MDIDGDAKPDFVQLTAGSALFGSPGSRFWKVFQNNGSGFNSTSIDWSTPLNGWVTSDFSSPERFSVFDINGDAKPDWIQLTAGSALFGSPGSRYWKVFLNSGTGFNSTSMNWSTPLNGWVTSDFSSPERFTVFDINGDTKPDWIQLTAGSALFGSTGSRYWKVFFNNGTGFNASSFDWSTPLNGWVTSDFSSPERFTIFDMNGDAKPDWIQLTAGSALFGSPGSRYWKVFLNEDATVYVEDGILAGSKIWPNPTHNFLFVDLAELSFEPSHLELRNHLGVLVLRQEVIKETVQINLEAFPAGLYTVAIVGGERPIVHKLILQ
jgi:hypothetical protein